MRYTITILFLSVCFTAGGSTTEQNNSTKKLLIGKWSNIFYEIENYAAKRLVNKTARKSDATETYLRNGQFLLNGKPYATWVLVGNTIVYDKGTKQERHYVIDSISNTYFIRKGPYYMEEPKIHSQLFRIHCKRGQLFD